MILNSYVYCSVNTLPRIIFKKLIMMIDILLAGRFLYITEEDRP